MATASQTLAEFATGLTFEKVPAEVVERAKTCIIDTVAAARFGAGLPWSKVVVGYAERNSAPGNALILGTRLRVRAPFASLANGALAHAFEMDSLCHPGVNVHPGASLTAPGDRAKAERLFAQLMEAEKVEDMSTLDFVLQTR
jgi:2-methylcitrate dehydratase PrpD